MDRAKRLTAIALATTAAAMFALAPLSATHAGGKTVKCVGVNACKGKSSCKGPESAGKGQNSCKGHGWVAVTKEVCEQLGGKVG